MRVTRRNFQSKLQAEISDGIENYWLKVWLIASSIHNYENGLSNSKSQLVVRRVFLAPLKTRNFARNFCVYRIFCNELTNEILAKIKVVKNIIIWHQDVLICIFNVLVSKRPSINEYFHLQQMLTNVWPSSSSKNTKIANCCMKTCCYFEFESLFS